MKHYVVGNIASRYDAYLEIKMFLGSGDRLYLVGNTVGLHEGGAEIVLDTAKDHRVSIIKGEFDHNVSLLYDELNRDQYTDLYYGCKLFTNEYLLKSYEKLTPDQRKTIAAVLHNAPAWVELTVGDKTYALKGGRRNILEEHFNKKGVSYEYPLFFHASDEILRFTVHPKAPKPINGLTIIDGFTPAVLLGAVPGEILRGDGFILLNNAIERDSHSPVAILCLETDTVEYIV